MKWLIPLILFLSFLNYSFRVPHQKASYPPAQAWVDSMYNAMSEDERIGQLMMIRAHSDKGDEHINEVKKLIEEYKIGGLCFFQGTPEKQIELINEYQALASPLPLMIAMDAEWGLGMRMKKSTMSFPKQLMLGAIQDNRLLYDMGGEIARQLRAVGVHVNFAPVADVNNNPENPVINYRSFGEDRYNVAVKSFMYMKGMQDNKVMACAKHFPGHGDTDTDSHLDLPVIKHDYTRLDSIELFPFQVLAEQHIGSMMVAHLNVPALDERENRPTTLSYNTITRLLKEGMEYEGLIFTDGLGMKGVTKHFKSGELEAEALVAGNDILLLPEDVGASVEAIKRFLDEGQLSWKRIEESVKKVLLAKYQLGVTKFEAIDVADIRERLSSSEALSLNRTLIANALTLVRDDHQIIPFQDLDTLQMAALSIGTSSRPTFQKRLADYEDMLMLQSPKAISSAEQQKLIGQLKGKDVVIVSIHGMSQHASKNFGIKKETVSFLKELQKHTRVVLSIFGNPYSLKYFEDFETVLVAYEENTTVQDLAAQALFGAIALKGRLPISATPKSKFGKGVMTTKVARFGYAPPQSMGIDTSVLNDIDALAENAIKTKATPGCVVLIAKEGKVVYEKAFGHHTYKKEQATDITDLYDLASLTKVAAATLAVMKLYEEGLIHLDTAIVHYLPELKGTNKEKLLLRDIMAHRAGLKDWIPFYEQTVERKRRKVRQKEEFYRTNQESGFSIAVASSLFLREDFVDTIYNQIYKSQLRANSNYRYSDLGFYLIAKIVNTVTGVSLDKYVDEVFYKPMGLRSITYNPHGQLDDSRIPPTERDNYFRLQTVQGYVHDMGAAMIGGVSGHAGLFGSAKDVAAIMQMLLNDGQYMGKTFLKPSTVELFTTRHPKDTRRAIGFDMRQLDSRKWINLPSVTSENTFGHTGFTGTCVWADPQHDLVYVFLSNRTYPSMDNKKLIRLKTRRRIFSKIYDAMGIPKHYVDLEDIECMPNVK